MHNFFKFITFSFLVLIHQIIASKRKKGLEIWTGDCISPQHLLPNFFSFFYFCPFWLWGNHFHLSPSPLLQLLPSPSVPPGSPQDTAKRKCLCSHCHSITWAPRNYLAYISSAHFTTYLLYQDNDVSATGGTAEELSTPAWQVPTVQFSSCPPWSRAPAWGRPSSADNATPWSHSSLYPASTSLFCRFHHTCREHNTFQLTDLLSNHAQGIKRLITDEKLGLTYSLLNTLGRTSFCKGIIVVKASSLWRRTCYHLQVQTWSVCVPLHSWWPARACHPSSPWLQHQLCWRGHCSSWPRLWRKEEKDIIKLSLTLRRRVGAVIKVPCPFSFPHEYQYVWYEY